MYIVYTIYIYMYMHKNICMYMLIHLCICALKAALDQGEAAVNWGLVSYSVASANANL